MPIEMIGLQTIGDRETGKGLCLRIEPGKPIIGSDPKILIPVFEDAENDIPGEAIPGKIICKKPGRPIQAIQAGSGANPDPAPGIFKYVIDPVVAQAVLFIVMDKMSKGPSPLIEEVQPFFFRADP
jgi:hypothetical protein